MSTTYVEGLGGIDRELSNVSKSNDRIADALIKIDATLSKRLASEVELNQEEVDRRVKEWHSTILMRLEHCIKEVPQRLNLYEVELASHHGTRDWRMVLAKNILSIIREVEP